MLARSAFGSAWQRATCRAIGVPVHASLTRAFDRLGTHRDLYALPIDQLTPAAFRRAQR